MEHGVFESVSSDHLVGFGSFNHDRDLGYLYCCDNFWSFFLLKPPCNTLLLSPARTAALGRRSKHYPHLQLNRSTLLTADNVQRGLGNERKHIDRGAGVGERLQTVRQDGPVLGKHIAEPVQDVEVEGWRYELTMLEPALTCWWSKGREMERVREGN